MSLWKTYLKGDPVDWLLEEENPSVRYLALTKLLDRSEEDREVRKARAMIMKTGPVPEILNHQDDRGCWDLPEKFYTSKYRGTVWQLVILAGLEADPDAEKIKKACEFILNTSQERESGGFSVHSGVKTRGGTKSYVIPCLTGNLIYSLIKLGFQDDPRVRKGIGWITRYQRFDDGAEQAPAGWPYDPFEMCWGKHTCHMGAVKTLKALAEIPFAQRSEEVRKTIADGVEFLLRHHIYKKSHNLGEVSKPGWLRLGFPLMYNTDILEILSILADLGCRDERMSEALSFLISKQNNEGKWVLQNTYNGRFWVDFEEKGKLSKWITLKAMVVLKQFYGE